MKLRYLLILLATALLGSAQTLPKTVQVNATTNVLTTPSAASFASANSLATSAQLAALSSVYQPLDADLTAISALSTTAYGRSLLAAADATALRILAGAVIGTDVQGYDADLTSIAGNTTGGFLTRAAANTYAARTLTGTLGQITVNNGDGASGNPTISLPSTITQATTFNAGLSATGATEAFTISGGGTATQYQRFNTTGGNYYLGVSSSTGTGLLSGSGNYSLALLTESARNLAFGTGNTLRVLIDGTTGATAISSTTASTSTTTGAFTVAGGAGFAGDTYIGGSARVIGSVFLGVNNSSIVSFKSASSTVGMGLDASDNLNFGSGGVFPASYKFFTVGGVGLTVGASGNTTLGSTTEATTGGAGSVTTAGGIYSAKKAIAALFQTPAYTVATLPTASASPGAIAYVTDSNATTRYATVAGGGSSKVIVFSDGTNWLIL